MGSEVFRIHFDQCLTELRCFFEALLLGAHIGQTSPLERSAVAQA